jgi:hypothetical protein
MAAVMRQPSGVSIAVSCQPFLATPAPVGPRAAAAARAKTGWWRFDDEAGYS